MAGKRKVSEEKETKRARFVRLAEQRTSKVLHAIRLIGNLSNRNNYEFNAADGRKIVAALSKEVDDLRRRFEDSSDRTKSGFKL